MSEKIIMFDGGHGGREPGAVNPRTGTQEAPICDAIAGRCVAKLRNIPGVRGELTKPAGEFLSLSGRATVANNAGADRYLAIHGNASGVGATGFEVWTSPGDTDADPFATLVFAALAQARPNAPGRKDMSDGDPDKESNFTVLRRTLMPAVLAEIGFIDNDEFARWIEAPDNQDRIAAALVSASLASLGIRNFIDTPPAPNSADDDAQRIARIEGLARSILDICSS